MPMNTVFLNEMPMRICGKLPDEGLIAPDFQLVASDLSEIALADFTGQRLVLNIFPSLDTEVCAASVRRFNKEVASLPGTSVLCVSKDLPFASARFCTVNGIENVRTASAFRSDFGRNYGVELVDGPLRGLFARAVVVIDENRKIISSFLCEQLTNEPDYDLVRKVLEG